MPNRRILLVDDDPNDVELALAALAKHGLAEEVVVVRDGEEALDLLYRRGEFRGTDEFFPAVILLDLKMPKVDGREVLRELKSDPRLKVIPIIILTTSRDHRDLSESYQLGVNAYVVKPVDFSDFVDAVGRIGYFWSVLNEAPPLGPPSGSSANKSDGRW